MAEVLSNLLTLFEDNRSLDVPVGDLEGRYRIARATKISHDFAQNDTLKLIALPSHVKLSAVISRWRTTALGASVTLSIGFKDDARPAIKAVTAGSGITGKTAFFVSAADVSSAASGNAMSNVAIADENKYLWEMAGCSADPKLPLVIQALLAGANPASGSVLWEQGFVRD